MRRSQIIMGTGVSIDIPGASEDVFESVFALLHEIDNKFSAYKQHSELSRYQRQEIKDSQLSDEMSAVINACARMEKETAGYFSAFHKGTFDPTGYVKGWAIAEAGKLINNTGYKTFCIGIGGDILASSDSKKTWKVGIQNPENKKYLTSQVSLSSGAIATSGNYERGQHIIDPKTGQPAQELLSVSVVGPDIIMADVLATACFAAGENWLQVIKGHPKYQILVIKNDGKIQTSKGWLFNRNQGSNQS